MRQLSTILAAAGVGLRRGTFSLAKKYPKRHLRGVPLRDSPYGGNWISGTTIGTCLSNGRCVCAAAAHQESNEKLQLSFGVPRWMRILQHLHHKAPRRKGRKQFHNRRSGRAGQTIRPFDTLVPKIDRQLACLKLGIPKGLAPGRRFGYFLDEEKVTRRRPTPASAKMVLTCRNATQNNLS